mmetsp:Transcript_26793/g.72338  ORF Transcript_26793/g.72338 Transcript_26793/m.72338 type:complete len:132 (-) Transcript_26793:5501-5896(-)
MKCTFFKRSMQFFSGPMCITLCSFPLEQFMTQDMEMRTTIWRLLFSSPVPKYKHVHARACERAHTHIHTHTHARTTATAFLALWLVGYFPSSFSLFALSVDLCHELRKPLLIGNESGLAVGQQALHPAQAV